MKHSALLVAAALFAGGVWADATIDGKTVIVPPAKDGSAVARHLTELAGNLREAIEESVGLRLKVIPANRFTKGRAIYLGAAAAEKAGILPDDLAGFDNVYAEKNGDIYLFGRDDCPRAEKRKTKWMRCVLPTVKAATRFMEDAMDVRFLAPGKMGADVPKRDKIALATGTFSRHHPDQIYAPSRLDTMLYSYAANQFGYGRFHSYGGHTYPKACPPSKYFKDHPEYFGLVGGKRRGVPERNPTLCISNPAVEDLIVNELLARYDEGVDICQLGQQDGRQFCQCEKCRNLFGATDLGEQLWLFHRKIAERIEKLRPGKIVQIISYGPTATPPKTFRKFPSNVMIEQCRASEEAFRAWDGYTVPHGFTVYIYLWGNYPFLGAMAKHSYVYLADFIHLLQRNNVHGIYRCGYGEFYGTEGPGYYVFNTLLGHPDADVDALVGEYCARAYGPAAGAMRHFHDEIDKRLRGTDKVADTTYEHGGKGLPELRASRPKCALDLHAYIYTPAVVAKLDDYLARAEATPGLTDKQKTRIHLVRLEYDYARLMGEIATEYAAYRFAPSAATFDILGNAIERRQQLIARYSQGQKQIPRLSEWPEIRFFGSVDTKVLMTNGRLSAMIGAPLGWNVKLLREKGVLPGAKRELAKVKIVAAAPDFADFNAGAWTAAPWLTMGGNQLQSVDLKGRFKVLADAEALYVAAESDLADAVEVKGVAQDGPAWRFEDYDMTIDPFGGSERYFHFVWNPVEGSRFDAAFGLITDRLDPHYNRADERWSGDWSFQTARANGVWRTLARIPYATLGAKKPAPGERWFFNLGRAANFTGRSKDMKYLLWNPNLTKSSTLCDPDALGVLEFE